MDKDLKRTIKTTLLFGINAVLFVTSLIITIFGVSKGAGDGQLGQEMVGFGYFKAFTIDSNVFMGLVALFYLVFQVREKYFHKTIPHFANVIYLMGATSVFLTFLTVVVFLAPMNHENKELVLALFSDDMFFFHVLNPLLATLGFFLLDDAKPYGLKENILAILPMILYSGFYIVNVAILKTWSDFYGFTFGGKMGLVPLVILVMYSVTFFIAFGIRKLKGKICK